MTLLQTIGGELITWLWVFQSGFGACKAHNARVLTARHRVRLSGQTARPSPVALIVPAKGVSESFDRFLDLVLEQDHPAYRLIFVTESEADPARAALSRRLGLTAGEHDWRRPAGNARGPSSVVLVTAGLATKCGQKVHNQLAAFRTLEPEDAIVALADSDIVGHRDWLRLLTAPLDEGIADATTGYRWFVPASASLPNTAAMSINATVAVFLGPRRTTLLWGGSSAITRSVFEQLQIPSTIENCLCEDLPITRALHAAGKQIRYVRPLVMPTPEDFSWSSLFEFGRRQYFLVRIYWPRIWWTALILVSLYLAGFVVSWTRLIAGEWIAAAPISLVFLFNSFRTVARKRYLADQFEPAVARKVQTAMGLEWFTTTLNYFVHWLIILSSSCISKIRWAGTLYRLQRGKPLEVLERTPLATSVPSED